MKACARSLRPGSAGFRGTMGGKGLGRHSDPSLAFTRPPPLDFPRSLWLWGSPCRSRALPLAPLPSLPWRIDRSAHSRICPIHRHRWISPTRQAGTFRPDSGVSARSKGDERTNVNRHVPRDLEEPSRLAGQRNLWVPRQAVILGDHLRDSQQVRAVFVSSSWHVRAFS
jgi:hypothetical protein